MYEPKAAIQIDVYSRSECHLCEDAKNALERARQRYDFILRIIDIDGDPSLEARYGTEIPVVFINNKKAYKYRVDEVDLERKLAHLWKT